MARRTSIENDWRDIFAERDLRSRRRLRSAGKNDGQREKRDQSKTRRYQGTSMSFRNETSKGLTARIRDAAARDQRIQGHAQILLRCALARGTQIGIEVIDAST